MSVGTGNRENSLTIRLWWPGSLKLASGVNNPVEKSETRDQKRGECFGFRKAKVTLMSPWYW